MNNPQLEADVSRLKEEVIELRQLLNDLQKEQKTEYKSNYVQFRDMMNNRKEIHDQYSILAKWKEGIDNIMEKIKKFLPII